MFSYKPILTLEFRKDADGFAYSNEIRSGLDKSVSFILKNPYHKAVKVKGVSGLLRKHVCANRFRIFYFVNEVKKEIIFAHFRPKNKNTYKNL